MVPSAAAIGHLGPVIFAAAAGPSTASSFTLIGGVTFSLVPTKYDIVQLGPVGFEILTRALAPMSATTRLWSGSTAMPVVMPRRASVLHAPSENFAAASICHSPARRFCTGGLADRSTYHSSSPTLV